MALFIDLTSQRFGRLTARSLVKRSRRVYWLCECDCGCNVTVRASNLRNGNTQSCGCLRIDSASLNQTTHGKSDHPLYEVWKGVKSRCLNSRKHNYHNYGGRGITVCKRWLHSFENFWKDTFAGWKPGLQLDRIKNEKGYCPSNCRWSTPKIQARNRRDNKLTSRSVSLIRRIHARGDESQASLARQFKVSKTLIYLVLHRKCWN